MRLNNSIIRKIFLSIVFVPFIICFPQTVIKEKVELKTRKLPASTIFNGCSYDFYSESQDELRFIPDSIAPGDTSILQVWIVGSGYEYEFNDNQYYVVQRTITIGPQYGNIISETADGNFVFVASKNIPDSVKTIKVDFDDYIAACVIASNIVKKDSSKLKVNMGMSKKSGSNSNIKNVTGGCFDCGFYPTSLDRHYGSGSITIKSRQYSIKFIEHAPWSIWPTLLPGGVTRSEANNLPGYNPERSFTILVTDPNGNPVKNVVAEMNSIYQQGSGGHLHGGSINLLPPKYMQGTFSAQSKQGNSVELTTDNNGSAVIDYKASQIGGNYLITASLKSEPSVKDTVFSSTGSGTCKF